MRSVGHPFADNLEHWDSVPVPRFGIVGNFMLHFQDLSQKNCSSTYHDRNRLNFGRHLGIDCIETASTLIQNASRKKSEE
jgi:hypothetical protein